MSYTPEQNREITDFMTMLGSRALLVFGVLATMGVSPLEPLLAWRAPQPWEWTGLVAHLAAALYAGRGGIPVIRRRLPTYEGGQVVRRNVYHSRESTIVMMLTMTASLAIFTGLCLFHGVLNLASAGLQLTTLLLIRFLPPLREGVRRRAMALTFTLGAVAVLAQDLIPLFWSPA